MGSTNKFFLLIVLLDVATISLACGTPSVKTIPQVIKKILEKETTTTTPSPPSWYDDFPCGQVNWPSSRSDEFNEDRIVGGKIATPHLLPWQAAISVYKNGKYQTPFCGGSIVSPRHVLSSATCMDGENVEEVRVSVSDHNVKTVFDGEIFHEVGCIISHPEWKRNSNPKDNNIAILTMKHKIHFNENVAAICLPGNGFVNYDGSYLVASGWGQSSETASFDSNFANLHYATLKGVSNSVCGRIYSGITQNILCAESFSDDKPVGTCRGDGGGPLIHYFHRKYYQVGIITFISGCARKGSPSGFTRVSPYIEWLIGHGVYRDEPPSC